MLAEVIKGMMASSLPMPSPMSQLMSICMQPVFHFQITGVLQLHQILLLRDPYSLGFSNIGHDKPKLSTRLHLCQLRQVGANDMAYPRVAAGSLVIGH